MSAIRHLVIVFGDQLDADSAAFDGFDPDRDAVLMMEVAEEATYVAQHKQRLVLFFAAMRHFRDALRDRGMQVYYVAFDDDDNSGAFDSEIGRWLKELDPEAAVAVLPGDHRVLRILEDATEKQGCTLDLREDRHFLCTPAEFDAWAEGRQSLLLEHFYRAMRRKHDILMEDGEPAGGEWNYDSDNREAFGRDGPGEVSPPRRFRPDGTTRAVIDMVAERFADAPGSLDRFDYPVTRKEACAALADFIENRLARFGRHQDAMWAGEPFLFHSRLSTSLNLKLLSPREAIDAAVAAWRDGNAPLAAVEGFVRQILGWREYVRGVYWREMPDYADANVLDADCDMPDFMWTGETDMACLSDSVGQLVEHAYAHHIQRLMVLGLFALLLGVRPYAVHRWHMAMYADAVDWVSLPNVLGMSQYADGGLVGTKPYVASGAYIDRMSNYCRDCRYEPKRATGEDACPFTTLYWDFLSRHRNRLKGNRRMGFQLRNLDRKDDAERRAIRERAKALKAELG